jgi:ComF family protein
MQPARIAHRLATKMLDFALPPRCPGCGTITPDPHSFCLECWSSLDLLGEPCCACCGLPWPYEQPAESLCAGCLGEPPAFERLRAAVAYGPVARKVALKLKYGGRPGLAETMARLMDRHAGAVLPDALLIPVPLHRWRIWGRGYNQAALIARALARRTRRDVQVDLLRRVKATPSLRGLGRRARADAVRGAFAIDPEARKLIAGRSVLLVDDVYTSGATAGGCARALKRAGASRVDIICWARVVVAED